MDQTLQLLIIYTKIWWFYFIIHSEKSIVWIFKNLIRSGVEALDRAQNSFFLPYHVILLEKLTLKPNFHPLINKNLVGLEIL